ncbi:hypothetical protein KC318_g4814 [Hortaea werneckii]|nr:hypothetical protein KC334_g14935 [Hortaea werneckii]KAI6947111.1 hypothetical protein KC355_g14916 [Hortaea werneckii]KAI7160181.1 hypothetical protein KC324_g13454 [Hortaea werneckii]KAI7553715.1 hypothetical protein KC316_g13970 [Hortaea werneckii]KAI7669196.1 hypothetical protein KC318_g4814 [Hortaea werneckii]
MSLRLPRLTTRSVARTTRLFFTPPTNQPSLRPLLNSNTPLRSFAFYRRSVREEDVPVVSADKVPRLPLFSSIARQQEQYLWMQLRHGLSEDEYKDVAAKVEMRVTEAVVAAYARSQGAAHSRQQVLTDTASNVARADDPPTGQEEGSGEAAATTSVVNIRLIYKPPHPKFPRLEGAASIDFRVYSEEDLLPLLDELRDEDDRISFAFVQPLIFDA